MTRPFALTLLALCLLAIPAPGVPMTTPDKPALLSVRERRLVFVMKGAVAAVDDHQYLAVRAIRNAAVQALQLHQQQR